MAYKGKSTTRSWATLPPELIRLVTTFHILDVSSATTLPVCWQPRNKWQNRLAYTVVRDAAIIENLMQVTPAWSSALEFHTFWQKAAVVLDPGDNTLVFARQHRLSPYRHYKINLFQRTCIPCRINFPATTTGLLAAKRIVLTKELGYVACCKDHRKDRFCGVCMRDSSHDEIYLTENEECEIWPSIETTCRVCRGDALWKVCMEGQPSASGMTKEAEAVGGRNFAAEDWEARQAVETFVDGGEGCVREVIGLCMEKLWLRQNTKIVEMLNLAIATSRMQTRMVENAAEAGILTGGMGEYESEEDLSELEEEEDTELMSLTEEGQGVRELAINDWARTRILDGQWYSPADQWHLLQSPSEGVYLTIPPDFFFPYVRAQHPVSWILPRNEVERPHPDPRAFHAGPPPSLNLCNSAYEAFRIQMHQLLYPAMENLVRKIVMECAVDGTDASVRVARMNVEDVAEGLRQEGVWFNGMDWVRRRRETKRDEMDDSSSSSEKSGSGSTSPVLSTSTLQTTPSPPPTEKMSDKMSDKEVLSTKIKIPSNSSQIKSPESPILSLPIAISPVLESPTQIPSIPFIPESMAEMPQFTIDTFNSIWREACAPLFQCKCRICERAVMKLNIEAGNILPTPQIQQSDIQGQYIINPQAQLIEVQLEPAPTEGIFVASDYAESDINPSRIGRKRSCDDAAISADEDGPYDVQNRDSRECSRTPPEKRQRLGKHEILAVPLRKRGSEEIDSGEGDKMSCLSGLEGGTNTKRSRTSTSPFAPPRSESESISDSEDNNALQLMSSDVRKTVPGIGDWGDLGYSDPASFVLKSIIGAEDDD